MGPRIAYRALVEEAAKKYVAAQDPEQFSQLLEFLEGRELRVIIEIGTYHGGTTYLLSQTAPRALIVSVDNVLRERPIDAPRASYIIGNSQESETVEKVIECLEGQLVDLLLIDGDHTYEGVKADWEIYSPLVGIGGLVAFHDILDWAPPGRSDEIAVWRLWEELKTTYRTREFVGPGTAGIGVIEIEDNTL